MNEEIKAKIYHKEDFYKGMAAIVSTKDWHRLTMGNAVAIAIKATNDGCEPGDISDAFVLLCEEKKRREKPRSDSKFKTE